MISILKDAFFEGFENGAEASMQPQYTASGKSIDPQPTSKYWERSDAAKADAAASEALASILPLAQMMVGVSRQNRPHHEPALIGQSEARRVADAMRGAYASIAHFRQGVEAIKRATIEGRVCDDVAWFDTITTLHDYCDQLLAATPDPATPEGAEHHGSTDEIDRLSKRKLTCRQLAEYIWYRAHEQPQAFIQEIAHLIKNERAAAAERAKATAADPNGEIFDSGVEHAINLLAKALGVTNWVPAEGSEEYDTDVMGTLMNIMTAKGLYDDETGAWATLAAAAPAVGAEPVASSTSHIHLDEWRCSVCNKSAPEEWRVFGVCYRCGAQRSIDRRERKIASLKAEIKILEGNATPPDHGGREALRLAVGHLDRMAKFIKEANVDYHCGSYSLAGLDKDLPTIRAALSLPQSASAEPPAPADDAWLRSVETVNLIEVLRAAEGDSVTILCDNPDFNGQANCAVECNGAWTGFQDRRFSGDTIMDCLRGASVARASEPSAAVRDLASALPDIEDTTIGGITWHSSEDGGGPDVGVSLYLGPGEKLYAGEISDVLFVNCGGAEHFDSAGGWFLVHFAEKGGTTLVGKLGDRGIAQDYIESIAALARRAAAAEDRERAAERRATVFRRLLEPFAEDAYQWADSVPDDHRPLCTEPVCTEPGSATAHPGSEAAFTVGHLRAAAAAVSQPPHDPELVRIVDLYFQTKEMRA